MAAPAPPRPGPGPPGPGATGATRAARLPLGGLGTARLPVAGLAAGWCTTPGGHAHLASHLHDLAHPLAHLRLGHRAEEAVHDLPTGDCHDHGDALHLQRGPQLRVRVDVYLGENPVPGGLIGQLFQHRAELLTGAAPFGPQIEDYRNRARPLNDLHIEGFLGHVDDVATRRGTLLARARGGLLTALRGGLPRTQVNGAVERKVPRLLHISILPHASHALTATVSPAAM